MSTLCVLHHVINVTSSSSDHSLHLCCYIVHHILECFWWNSLNFSPNVHLKLFQVSGPGICINMVFQRNLVASILVSREAAHCLYRERSDAQETVFVETLMWPLLCGVGHHLVETTVFSFGSHCLDFEPADITLE